MEKPGTVNRDSLKWGISEIESLKGGFYNEALGTRLNEYNLPFRLSFV